MNIKEWINSGSIEAYVMGELNNAEAREVEEMADRYPEVKTEIVETETALEGLARKTAVKPRAGLKDDLFSRIDTTASEVRTETSPKTETLQSEVSNCTAADVPGSGFLLQLWPF